MYDLHHFRDITLLRVTFFKAFTSLQRVFLQRLQNAGRRNLFCEIAFLTCTHQKKVLFHWRAVVFRCCYCVFVWLFGWFLPPFRVDLGGKGIFMLKILSSSLTDFYYYFLLSAVDDMHALISFSSISTVNHTVNPWFQNY